MLEKLDPDPIPVIGRTIKDGELSGEHLPKRAVASRKRILKAPLVMTRAQGRNLGNLIERLRGELSPSGALEEFMLEKLAIDIARLAKMYEYDKEIMQGCYEGHAGSLHPKLESQIVNGYTDPFLRYKASIEKDIKEGYSSLRALKKDREKQKPPVNN